MTKRKQQINLIEILVVSLVLVILVVVTVPKFMKTQYLADITQVVQDLELLSQAMKAYELDQGTVPPDFDGEEILNSAIFYNSIPRSEIFTYQLLTTPIAYIQDIPYDPYTQALMEEGLYYKKDLPLYEYSKNLSYQGMPSQILWTISSAGPDLSHAGMFMFNDHEEAKVFSFSITNGLHSRGDIFASNHGIVDPF